jgi:hypothetical protein
MRRRSGSQVDVAVLEDVEMAEEVGDRGGREEDGGMEVVAEISASISSCVMSPGWSLWDWDISARMRVRSTRVSRPSAEERRRMLIVLWNGVERESVPSAFGSRTEGEIGGEGG